MNNMRIKDEISEGLETAKDQNGELHLSALQVITLINCIKSLEILINDQDTALAMAKDALSLAKSFYGEP